MGIINNILKLLFYSPELSMINFNLLRICLIPKKLKEKNDEKKIKMKNKNKNKNAFFFSFH